MAVTVDFVTLGDASEKLSVPSATLRHWTDQMEEFEIHFVCRNNRNERIYYDTDLDIFAFLRDLKNEHGRRTTTKDLALMVYDKGVRGEFQLRVKEDAPTPKPSNRTADLLNQEDIQRLMQSDRVRQFIGVVIGETTKNLKDGLTDEVRKTLEKEMDTKLQQTNQKIVESYERIEQRIIESDKKFEERMAERERQTNEYIKELREKRKKKWWQRIFSD